tara:strand:- start:2175 stop:2909 length:735 start_codon:yes stop_codon:yes gene_type:complete
MKKFLLSFLLVFAYQLSTSQCATNATNFGNSNNVAYEVTGDVTVTLNTDNTVSLDLGSNFMTANGPDVRAFLVNSNGMSDAALKTAKIADLTRIEFGLVSCTGCTPVIPANGAKMFNVSIPNGQDIRDYDKIFFYCFQFDAFWDFGSFTPFTNANCTVLNVHDDNLKSAFKIYPNPTSDYVIIENNKQLSASVSVFNVLGKEVLKTEESSFLKLKLNLSSLKAGVYLLQTKSKNAVNTSRIIKQ